MTATALLIVAVVLTCFPIAGADDSLDEILQLEKSDREKIANAVEMCCPLSQWDCCRESLLFHRPIDCPGLNALQRIEIVVCLDRHMHGREHKPLVRDRICCEVFAANENDKNDVCRNKCNAVAMTPSLPLHAQQEHIRHCKLANQGLHGCFLHCVKWHEDHANEPEPWNFADHCHVEFTLGTSKPLLLFDNGEYDD